MLKFSEQIFQRLARIVMARMFTHNQSSPVRVPIRLRWEYTANDCLVSALWVELGNHVMMSVCLFVASFPRPYVNMVQRDSICIPALTLSSFRHKPFVYKRREIELQTWLRNAICATVTGTAFGLELSVFKKWDWLRLNDASFTNTHNMCDLKYVVEIPQLFESTLVALSLRMWKMLFSTLC